MALVVKNLPAEAGDIGLLRKILRRWAWELIPVFLPGKSHGRRNLVGYIVHGVIKTRTQLSDFTFAEQSRWKEKW